MPVTIGSKPAADFSNPIELLSDCHRRIERFLAVLVAVMEQARGGEMTDGQKREWLQALEYFRNAAPRHTADEEESLFPRLRHIDQDRVQKALAEMDELEADHDAANRLHAEVDEIGRRWLSEGVLGASDAQRIEQALARLSELYARHIAIEDESVFPLAAAVLADTDKNTIGEEMAQRRGLDPNRISERLVALGEQR